jgi:hypothetical protein
VGLAVKDLMEFMERVDRAVEGILVVREERESELPGRQPWMGPRYVVPGFGSPISVFRAEGVALYALARALLPAVAVELYTGTGYSALWIAGGAPEAEVYSIDNFSEGGTKDAGWAAVLDLSERMGLVNLHYIRGEASELDLDLEGRLADLLFCDGPADVRYARPEALVVRHDNPPFPDRTGFRVLGSSHFSVHCHSDDIVLLAGIVEDAFRATLEIPNGTTLTEVF